MPEPSELQILFSDYFQVDKEIIEQYGAIDVSLLGDLPLFIDPFLLFNNEDEKYKELHNEIIQYLDFLRTKSATGNVSLGDLKSLYFFKEVKQTWIGFSAAGNEGSGLGIKFARALNKNLYLLFNENHVSKGRHLEKLCLLSDGVGKDNISDFTTNLIKEYLLEYTQNFALRHLKSSQRKKCRVPKVRFNYTTKSWMDIEFTLPFAKSMLPKKKGRRNNPGDYVILVPKDLLTREETWINRSDLISSFDSLSPSLDNDALRSRLNEYLESVLPRDADAKQRREGIARAIEHYPEYLDYYIRHKEFYGDEATAISSEKVNYAKSVFLDKFPRLVGVLLDTTSFYQYGITTIDDVLARGHCLQEAIEKNGGYKFLYKDEFFPLTSEQDLRVAYRFIWFNPSHQRIPLNSINREDVVPVEFKLASNPSLSEFLEKRDVKALSAEAENPDSTESLTVIFAFSSEEVRRVEEYRSSLKSRRRHILTIDASLRRSGQLPNFELVQDARESVEPAMEQQNTTASSNNQANSTDENLPVFVCYAHRDNDAQAHKDKWLDRLIEHLSPLMDEESISVWSDKQLETGDLWDDVIKENLQSARVGILLVSSAFLASKYIKNSELPVLLNRAKEHGLVIIPIIINHCLFDETIFRYPDPKVGPQKLKLSVFQAANAPSSPLNSLSEAEQDKVLNGVAKRVKSLSTQRPR